MFLSKGKKIITSILVCLITIGVQSQSYNNTIEAKLQIDKENNLISITGIAKNKTTNTYNLSYKLSVFKTDANQNQSKNQQSGKLTLSANEQKDLSSTSVNFNPETKIIILLLIYDSNQSIVGKDRIVINENEVDDLAIKNKIAEKISNTATKISAPIGNTDTDIEAKIHTDNQTELTTIQATAFNKTAITKSLSYTFTLYNKAVTTNNIIDKKSSRFILAADKKEVLSSFSFKLSETEKQIGVLTIYNLDNDIIAKDMVVFNGLENEAEVKNKQILEKLKEATSKDVSTDARDGVELKGIVVEDTKTKPGQDFYKLFYSLYTQNNINGNKIVKIKEILALGRNTKIEVLVGDTVVFSFFVRPSNDYLTKMNDYAIIKVYRHFKNLEKESKTIKRY